VKKEGDQYGEKWKNQIKEKKKLGAKNYGLAGPFWTELSIHVRKN